MVRRAEWMVVIAAGLTLSVACGDDTKGKPNSGAGAGGTGTEAGSGSGDEPGVAGSEQGGSKAEPTPTDGGEAGAPAMGQGGMPTVVDASAVHGRLRPLGSSRLPQGLLVVIDGKRAPLDAEGNFTAPGVAETYDLTYFDKDGLYLQMYQGLTTREPTVFVSGAPETEEPNSAVIRGKLLGGLQPPYDENEITLFQTVAYVSDTHGFIAADSPTDAFSFELMPDWYGAASDTGTLMALQRPYYKDGTVTYPGFGQREVMIQNGQILGSSSGSDATDITLTDPDEVTINGALAVPEGYDTNTASIRIGGLSDFVVVNPGAFSIVRPDLGGMPVFLGIGVVAPDGSQSSVGALVPKKGAMALAVPEPPEIVSPADGATDIDAETVFSWSGLPKDTFASLYLVIGDMTVVVSTGASETKLPDFSQVGLRPPKNLPVTWDLTAIGKFETIEELLAAEGDNENRAGRDSLYVNAEGEPRTGVTAK